MKKYKDTFLARDSQIKKALDDKNKKEAEKIYKETTQRAIALYGKDDYEWFMSHNKE